MQLQRALHYENYTAAQEVRARRQGVDEAVRELQDAKGDGSGAKAACRTDAADLAAESLRLCSEMSRASSEERCTATHPPCPCLAVRCMRSSACQAAVGPYGNMSRAH